MGSLSLPLIRLSPLIIFPGSRSHPHCVSLLPPFSSSFHVSSSSLTLPPSLPFLSPPLLFILAFPSFHLSRLFFLLFLFSPSPSLLFILAFPSLYLLQFFILPFLFPLTLPLLFTLSFPSLHHLHFPFLYLLKLSLFPFSLLNYCVFFAFPFLLYLPFHYHHSLDSFSLPFFHQYLSSISFISSSPTLAYSSFSSATIRFSYFTTPASPSLPSSSPASSLICYSFSKSSFSFGIPFSSSSSPLLTAAFTEPCNFRSFFRLFLLLLIIFTFIFLIPLLQCYDLV